MRHLDPVVSLKGLLTFVFCLDFGLDPRGVFFVVELALVGQAAPRKACQPCTLMPRASTLDNLVDCWAMAGKED